MSKTSILMVAAAAGIAIAVPQAPAFAQGKGTTAGSAQKGKPSPTRTKYSKKKTSVKPVRMRTAAEVINPQAAARYNTYKNQKTSRQPVSQPGLFARFGRRVAAFFRRNSPTSQGGTAASASGTRPGTGNSRGPGTTTAASGSRMRPGVVSMVIGRLQRDRSGQVQDRALNR